MNCRKQRGAAIVETIVFVPVIFIMTFLTLEITNVLRVYNTISWTTEYGVRQASEGIGIDGYRLRSENVKQNIAQKMFKLFPMMQVFSSQICVDYGQNGTGSKHCNNSHDPRQYTAKPGDIVTVSISMPYDPIFNFEVLPDFNIGLSFSRVISGKAAPLD